MKNCWRSIFVLIVAGIVSLGIIQPVGATPSDIDALKQGVIAWETGWSAGDTLFTMDRVDNLYDQNERFVEFDTLSPAKTITQGYRSFKRLWETTMQASTQIKTVVDDNVQVITDGKLGLTTFTFQTEFTDRQTGKKYAEHGHASMVWEKQGSRWAIVHEHVSNPVRTS